MKLKRIDEVVNWRLCIGCGACIPRCENQAITLIDIPERGMRPIVDSSKCQQCGDCIKVCPGIEISQRPFDEGILPELRDEWGPVLEIWEGYAADLDIHYRGSSGGAVTALALFCLERQKASGVLHIGAKSDAPLRNVPVVSTSRDELLACTGSRYSPAAPCEKLDVIEQTNRTMVFVGKPCDVVALRKSQAIHAVLNQKIGLAISIFCAGTPTTAGTNQILHELGVRPEDVGEFRYRGCGWPGRTTVKLRGKSDRVYEMTYQQSWGNILSKHGQTRCRLCPDSTGELADISCGDPWYRQIESGEDGWSLVLARTDKGRVILREAMEAGYIKLERVDTSILPRSQKALLKRRRHLWGRLLMMRIMRVPAPRYTGFFLFRDWLRLSIFEKFRSLSGTLKRIVLRRWMKPLEPLVEAERLRESDECERARKDLNRSETQCKL